MRKNHHLTLSSNRCRHPDRYRVADSDAGACEPDHVVRAVDGASYVERVSSSLAFAAFLEDCYSRLSHSLEFIHAAEFGDAESQVQWPSRWPSLN